MSASVYLQKPKDFSTQLIAVACHIKVNEELLFLRKAEGQWSMHKWGIPCGRVEKDEDLYDGVLREVFEETGIKMRKENLKYLVPLYFVQPDIKYVFNMFIYELKKKEDIKLSNEHSDYIWLDRKNYSSVELISGQLDALNYYHDICL